MEDIMYRNGIKHITIENSLDKLYAVVEQNKRCTKKEKIKIIFKITDPLMWNEGFVGVFPELPDYITCDICCSIRDIDTLVFSKGAYKLINHNRAVYVSYIFTYNTDLKIIPNNIHCYRIYAYGSSKVYAEYIHFIQAYGDCVIKVSAAIGVRLFDNARGSCAHCIWLELYDRAMVVASFSNVFIRGKDCRIIGHNCDVTIDSVDFIDSNLIDCKNCTVNFNFKYNEDKIPGISDPRSYIADNNIYYKIVNKVNNKYYSIWDENYEYKIGEIMYPDSYDNDPTNICSNGIHIAPIEWCLNNYSYRQNCNAILEVEVPEDAEIVVPYVSDGKLRASRIKLLREVPIEEFGKLGEFYKTFYSE